MNAKVMMVIAGCVAAISAGAATFSLAPVDAGEPTRANAVSAPVDANVVKVAGRGVGTDRASALKDAYRDAVERAVGLYVDAEQMVKNDEMVNDQVLTQSNAYIEHSDIVKETTANGLVTVKILAVVRKRELAKKLTDVMPPNTVNLGNEFQNLHAQIESKTQRSTDGKALLENALKNVDPFRQLYTVDIVSPKPTISESKNAGKVVINYLFRIQIDRQKFLEVQKPIRDVLSQISLVQPSVVRLTPLTPSNSVYDMDEQAESSYIKGDMNVAAQDVLRRYGGVFGESVWLSGPVRIEDGESYPLIVKRRGARTLDCNNNHWECQFSERFGGYHSSFGNKRDAELVKNGFVVRLVDTVNDSLTACKATDYSLDADAAQAILSWSEDYGSMNQDAKFSFSVVFLSESKEEIAAFTRTVPRANLINAGFVELDSGSISNMLRGRRQGGTRRVVGIQRNRRVMWYASPFVGGSAKCFYAWKSFELPKDDLPKISSMSIEISE